ncbi:MAG: hypothetical protein LBS97_05770 [Treponema sp.]|nr:hypothetical protein [Treponema sp.]
MKDGKVISGQEAVKAYGQGVNALVLTTEKGDLSTLYHEYMHFVTAALIPNSPLYRNLLETAYNKKLDAFTDEDFDRLSYEFENYMKKGEAPTPGLKALFRRIAEALKDIVRGMRERYPLSPELKNVFDALFVGEVQAQKEQQAQAHTQAEQGRYQQAVEVSGAATGLSEEDKRIQKEYWDKTEAHRVMSSPLYSEAEKEVIFQMGSEALAEAQRQSEEVIRHYHNADGSARPGWLKAPNGKDSKLAAFDPTGRVWALARTPNFKKWFGDWEAAAELKITETNVAPDQAIEALKAFADKDLFNFETGITARINTKQRNKIVSNAALGKSLNNGFTAGQHNAVAANIDKIFKHASLVETAKDKGGDVNIVSIKRFASPVVFEHETAIAYLTLKESVEHGHRIYSLELIEIEKTPTKGSTPKEHTTARVSKGKVAQLYESVNSISKIIDENGEPKVFYHRSPNKFTEFDKNRNGTHNDAGWLGDGFYFYGIEEEGYGYGKNSYPVFLNMKEPYYATNEEHEELANADDREKSIAFTEDLKSEGYDGVYFNGDLREEAVTFSPNQIKSTDNTGTFGLGTGNIYFQTLGEQGAAVADKGTSPAVGWGTNNKEQENDRIQWGGKPGQDGQDHPSVQEVQGYRLGAGFDALQRPVADGSAGTGEDAGGGKGGGDSGTEGALGLEAANEKFNAELEQLVENKLPAGHIFKLGTPGPILRRSGFPAGQPIELSAKRLKEKSETERHPFSPSDIKGIVKAIQEPVAVFAYGDKNKAQNVIVELKKDDKNFLVGVHFNQERNGVFVSDIRGLYNKDNAEWLNWINQGKLLYADIEKLQSVVTQQQTNLAEVGYLDLEAIDRLLQKNKNVKHYFADTDAKILFQLSREDINGLALLYSSPEEWLRADLAMLDASTGSATGADATLDTLATDYLAAHSELAGESEEAVRERIKGWYAQVWNEAQAAFVERRQWEERETPTAAEQADAIPREKALEYVDEETLGRIQGKNTPPEAREGGYNASGTENDIETQPGEEEADFEDIEAVETDFDGEEEITVPVPQGDAQTEAGSESPAGGEKITTTEINRRFLKMLPGKVDSFIRMMGIVMVRSREDAQDEAEARQRDMDEEARETMQGEMNKHLKGIALGTRKGKEITSSQRKYALSVMSRNSTFYRELYSQIMLDKEFQEYARNEVRDNAAVEAARQAVGLTDYERAKIAEEVSDKELRKKILRQEASVEEVKEYLKHLDEDERKKDEQIAGYEKQAKEQIQKAAENLQDTKRMEAYIEKREREFKKTTDELESNIEQAYKEGKKTEKGIQRTRAEFKIAKLKAEIKRKQRERNAVLRYQAENNRLGRQIMSPAMVSGHIWVRQRELLLGIQNALFRSPDVRLYGVRSGNPTDSTDLADRGAIVVDGETMSLDEFVKRFWEGKIRYGFLDARLRKALRRTWESMADRRKYAAGKLAEKLTQSELQDILLVMRQLRNEGLANWSRREFVRNQDDRDMRRDIFNEQADIAAEGKTAEARKIIRAMKAADDQERERILKKGGRNWLMKLFFQTWDDKRLLQWMSGNTKGELYRLVIREYTKNTNQRNKATDKRIERVKGLLGKTEAEQMKKISEYGRRDITIEGIGPQYLDPAFRPGETEKKQIGASAAGKWIVYGPHLLPASRVIFSKAMLMYWYIAGENKFAMRHVIFGKLWSKDQQNLYEGNLDFREEEAIIKGKSDILNDAVKKHLTAEDKKVAEAIRDDFSAHWPEVKSQLEQMFNQLEEGQENYLPLQIIEGAHAQTEKESEVIALTQGAHQVKIQPDKGMGESRTDIGATHQQDIEMDIFKVFFRGVEQQEHFVKMAPYIRSLNNALRGMNNESKQIRERLTDTYGEWAMRRLDTHVNMMGLPPSARLAPASDSAGALARAFEGNTGAAMIAFNIPSWLAQYPQSIAPFFAKADPVFVLQALAEVMKPGSDLAERVWEKSPMVKNRVINTAQDYHESLQRQDSKWKRAQGKMIEIGMIGQRHADRTMVAAGWWALYETGRQKGMSDADATVWADEITAETQPNLKDIEVAPPFRDKGPGKLFFRFAQPLNVVWQNLTYDSFMSKEKSFGKIVGMFTAYGIAALIVAAMRGAIYDGDDEDEKGDVMRRVFYYLTVSSFAESVPLIADMASAGAERMITGDGKLYERQYFRLAKELFDIPGHVGDAEWEKALWDAVQAAGLATGAPVSQANRAKRAIENEDLWTLFGHNK